MSKTAALLVAAFLAAAASAGPATAADMAKPTGGQQSKMTSCNAEAGTKGLKGDARKSFMSDCLKGGSASTTAASPKMQQCIAQAEQKKLAGAAKTSFMKKCEATG